MTTAANPPLWLQGRTAVIAAADDGQWRNSRPDYSDFEPRMAAERVTRHAPGSAEFIVENLVQVFEMEVSHKGDPADWVSMDVASFRTRVNGGPWADAADIARIGSYNVLIGDSPYYDTAAESFDSSHARFHTALPGGFFWELTELLSGPPTASFTWRHWGNFDGPYRDHQPTGAVLEMYGTTVVRLNNELKIVELEHFYNSDQLLRPLAHGCPIAYGG